MKTKHKQWFALTASTLGLSGLSFASGFGDEKYTYDASGNVLEKQIGDQVTRYDYTGNQLNGSASDSGRKQYAYDSSGRLTTDSEAGKPTRNMEHQYLDKVTKVKNGDKTTELFYNAEGQLVATNSSGTSETFAWDGLAMVNRSGQLYVNEAHAVGGVPAIVDNEVAVSDMIGSSLSVGSESFQATAYGEGLAAGLFTGKPFIESLDGFCFKYRNYSSTQMQWMSPDPSGFPDGTNPLSYVRNNPTTKIDPLGLVQHDAVPTPYTPNPGTADARTAQAILPTVPNTVKTKAVANSTCKVAYFSPTFKAKTTNTIHTPVAGTYNNFTPPQAQYPGAPTGNLVVSPAFVGDQQTHENVHVTLIRLFADKTWGKFETWSTNYQSNEFSSDTRAMQAASDDELAAANIVFAYISQGSSYFGDNAPNHTGWHPVVNPPYTNPITYTAQHTGPPQWGGAATAKINSITINWPKITKGDCEK